MIRRSLGGALLAVTTVAIFAGGVSGPTGAEPAPHLPKPPSGPGTNYAADDPFTAQRTQWWRDDRHSETYQLTTLTSNTVRLWINDKLVIDDWVDHGPTVHSVSLPLVAGQRYKIRLDVKKESNEATAKLLWSSPNTPQQTVPTTQLYPAA